MCYDERLFRSWLTKKAHKREQSAPVGEQDRPRVVPLRPAPTHQATRRKEMKRELEETA